MWGLRGTLEGSLQGLKKEALRVPGGFRGLGFRVLGFRILEVSVLVLGLGFILLMI